MKGDSAITFPPASLTAQLAELRREREMRVHAYPHFVENRRLTQAKADYQCNALDAAIKTLERLVAAEARGEPGRKELIKGLRKARERLLIVHGDHDGRAEIDGSRAHRALAKAAPTTLLELIAAIDAVTVAEPVPPRARMALERAAVHQIAKALGVKA